jgi:hypothetical protein
MCSTLPAVYHWLQANEAIAMWVEGIALVLIFGLELAEYKRQGRERKEQHEESAAQMKISRDTADAAKVSADAVRNSERAWLMLDEFRDVRRNNNRDGIDAVFKFKNFGKTPAWVVEYCFSFVQVSEEIYRLNRFEFGIPDTFPSGNPVPPLEPYDVMRAPLILSEDIVLHPDANAVTIFYGYIKYRDVFYEDTKEIRETYIRKRFERTQHDIIMHERGRWVYDGPPEANRHT